MVTVPFLTKPTRFLENACNTVDSRYFSGEGEFNNKLRDVDVDKLYQDYVPVMAGVAKSVEEVRTWPLDKYIVMTGLANRILDDKDQRRSKAVTDGIINSEGRAPQQ